MKRPNGYEPNYIELLEKYCDYLESFVGIIRTTDFKPLEGQPLEVLKQTARKSLSDKPTKFVTTFCEKCRKPYCTCNVNKGWEDE